ncbi:MAG TPA: hypothetical protein VJ961_09345 [Mariprofundaceae bacterium]|nr:hypothetical protein [Mariprofundaceae bacterium]
MNLEGEIRVVSRMYIRKGEKAVRKRRQKQMLRFAKFSTSMGVHHLGQLGRRHVINFWRCNREMPDDEVYEFWIALTDLWWLADKHGDVPKPLGM